MDQELLEKHEALVVDMGNAYLDNMALELGKKYQNQDHQIYPTLTDVQFKELKAKHNVTDLELADVYAEFLRLKPTSHLKNILDAFHASGGNVDIEPRYDESTQRLDITIHYVIKDNTLDTIEGLSPIEDILVKMNAMMQIDSVLSGSDPDMMPQF